MDIVNKICAIPLPLKSSQDRMVWGFSANGVSPCRILSLIEDIRWLASRFSQVSFKHILREANFVAPQLALTI